MTVGLAPHAFNVSACQRPAVRTRAPLHAWGLSRNLFLQVTGSAVIAGLKMIFWLYRWKISSRIPFTSS